MERTRKKELDYDMVQMFDEQSSSEVNPLKIYGNLYRNHKLDLSISIVCFFFRQSPVWAIPIIFKNFIDYLTEPEQYTMRFIGWNIAILLILIIQNIPFQVLHVKYMSKAIRHVEAGLRSTLSRKLQSLSIAYHNDMQSGRIQAKVIRDVEAIETLSKQTMVSLWPAIFNVISAIVIVMFTSFYMSLFFVFTIPIAIVIIWGFKEKLKRSNHLFRREVESMSGQVSEMVEMIPVTRAHGLSDLEVKNVDRKLGDIMSKGMRLDIIEAFFGASNWASFQIFQGACLLFSVYLALQGVITIGDVVLFQALFVLMVNGVMGTMNVYPQIAKGFESIHSITEVLLSRDTEEYQGRRKVDNVEGELSFQNVSFQYRGIDQDVLKDFNLTIRPGESLALVGESGSGKSTILNLILGFYRPTEGQVLVGGIPMDELNMPYYRRSLSVVLQNSILFSGTIRENIAYGMPSVSDDLLNEVIEMANLRSVIDKLPDGIHTRIGEHGGKLSGGQRQRIAIARAFIRDPKIIIMDEATSALDNKSEALVQKALERLMAGRTSIVVAHRLSTIRNVDRIAVMLDGRCVETGTYDELLLKKGEFYQLKNQA